MRHSSCGNQDPYHICLTAMCAARVRSREPRMAVTSGQRPHFAAHAEDAARGSRRESVRGLERWRISLSEIPSDAWKIFLESETVFPVLRRLPYHPEGCRLACPGVRDARGGRTKTAASLCRLVLLPGLEAVVECFDADTEYFRRLLLVAAIAFQRCLDELSLGLGKRHSDSQLQRRTQPA